jgi:DNA-binding SARP family transcriptional activator/tetratricopeptide (TPR) repeat protein
VEFRILGALEVTNDDGTPVRLPAGRAQAVLALLCAAGGRVVSRDRLIEEAWNGAPPTTAITQVQGFVSALRRTLGASVIETRSDGYRIAERDGVDLVRLRRLVAAARAARSVSDLSRAAALLDEGLRLWRGRPFEGMTAVSLETEADRIEAERASALEEFAALQLALGQHAALAEPLAGWVSEYPLREGLRSSLMQALSRSGRQAEAIACYHDLRARLAGQLGVGPSPALQELCQRILAGDPSVLTPVSRPPAVVPGYTPAQIPAGVVDFTGRAEYVSRLCKELTATAPAAVVVSALSGTGGIGKSALAVHVAHLIAGEFPDGQLFVNLAGTSAEPAAPGEALARLLRDLGVPAGDIPSGLEERSARFRSVLSGRRLLLVLDDARDAAQVRPLLPGSPACAVLVTSRIRMPDLAGSRQSGLDVLQPDEGRELLARIVGSARAAAEPEAVTEVVRLCAGLPLAIRIAGAKAVARPGWSIADLAGRMAAEHSRLGELALGDLAVRASFRLSYDGLADAAAAAFRLLGLLPVGEFGLGVAAALLDLPPPHAERLLDVLTDAHMLEAPAPGRYRLHDLLRLFAAELAATELEPARRSAAVIRLVTWYGAALGNAADTMAQGRPMPPGSNVHAPGAPAFGSYLEAMNWCYDQQDSLNWAVRAAADEGAPRIAVRMACLLKLYAERSGSPDCSDAAFHAGLACARDLGDVPAEAWLLKAIGNALIKMNREQESVGYLEGAMSLYVNLGDRVGEATILNNLGSLRHNLREFETALQYFERSREILEEFGMAQMVAMALSNAGTACRSLARYDAALAYYDRALEIQQRLDDRHGEGVSRLMLSQAYRLLGRYDEALEQADIAVAIHRDMGTRPWWLLSALDERGLTLAALGRASEARESWIEAVVLAEGSGDPRASEFRGRLAGGT